MGKDGKIRDLFNYGEGWKTAKIREMQFFKSSPYLPEVRADVIESIYEYIKEAISKISRGQGKITEVSNEIYKNVAEKIYGVHIDSGSDGDNGEL